MKRMKRYIIVCFVFLGLMASCIEEADDISGKGTNRFRLSSADEYSVAVIEANPIAYTLINIWRDATSEANLDNSATVQLEADNQLIADWNTANGTSFEPLPASLYTLEGPTLTFDKGVFNYTVKFTPKPGDPAWDYSKAYAIGVKLTNPSAGYEVTSAEDKAVIAVVVKNPYEADYATSGYFFHPSAPRAMADSKYLATLGPTKSQAGLGDLYGANYWFNFEVDGSDNLINWESVGSTPASPGGSGFMTLDNPGGIDYSVAASQDGVSPGVEPYTKDIYNNTYDPDAKIFWMHYGYRAGGTLGQIVFNRQAYEKWIRK